MEWRFWKRREPRDQIMLSWGGEPFYFSERDRNFFCRAELEIFGPKTLRDIVALRRKRAA